VSYIIVDAATMRVVEEVDELNPKPIISDTGNVYRVDHPEKEQALVVVLFGKLLLLDHIGPELDGLQLQGDLEEQLQSDFDSSELADGLYLWSGSLKVDGHYSYYGEYDCEVWLEGEFVAATEEGWKSHIEGDSVWDSRDWLVDSKTRDAFLEECEMNHELSPKWPPSRFNRTPVI
jgi:hypothetical protein